MLTTKILRSDADKAALFTSQYDEMERTLVYFERRTVQDRTFLVALDGEQVIGIVCIKESSRRVPGALTISYVSVREDRRKKGVGKLLVKALFEFAKVEGFSIANTQYDDDGQLYLRPLLEAAALVTTEVVFHEFPYNLR
jgi:predicted N-acetyltransferase YhbS